MNGRIQKYALPPGGFYSIHMKGASRVLHVGFEENVYSTTSRTGPFVWILEDEDFSTSFTCCFALVENGHRPPAGFNTFHGVVYLHHSDSPLFVFSNMPEPQPAAPPEEQKPTAKFRVKVRTKGGT